MQPERARFRDRDRAQIVDEARQHLRLVEDGLQMRLVRGMHPVDERLDVALDHRERRP